MSILNSEDFNQWIELKRLEGKRVHTQNRRQLYIDFVREMIGRRDSAKYESNINSLSICTEFFDKTLGVSSFIDQEIDLKNAVKTLNFKQRVIFKLKFKWELNFREIGDVVGLNEITVSKHFKRACFKIRNFIEGD